MNQPELFPDVQAPKPKRFPWPVLPGRFLRLRVAYEDMIFGALGLVLVLLAGFCLGVERGRGLVRRDSSEQTLGLASAASGSVPAHSAAVPEERQAPVIPAAVSPPPAESVQAGAPAGSYAIQLASYAGAAAAQEEARRLSRQGFHVQVLTEGRFAELRAVGYRSWADANRDLTRLRKTYRDAFIKRVSSSK